MWLAADAVRMRSSIVAVRTGKEMRRVATGVSGKRMSNRCLIAHELVSTRSQIPTTHTSFHRTRAPMLLTTMALTHPT